MGDVAEIVKNSENILKATIRKDAEAVAQYLREVQANGPAACAREVPLLKYNDDAEWWAVPNSLSCVITLYYLKARDYYALRTILRRITREEHSGEGFVDFLFQPVVDGYPAMVLELHVCAPMAKCGHSAEDAIEQITPNGAQCESKNYMDNLRKEREILLVGINYNKDTKEHTCIIEAYK